MVEILLNYHNPYIIQCLSFKKWVMNVFGDDLQGSTLASFIFNTRDIVNACILLSINWAISILNPKRVFLN